MGSKSTKRLGRGRRRSKRSTSASLSRKKKNEKLLQEQNENVTGDFVTSNDKESDLIVIAEATHTVPDYAVLPNETHRCISLNDKNTSSQLCNKQSGGPMPCTPDYRNSDSYRVQSTSSDGAQELTPSTSALFDTIAK
jgi:hypothetical protein